MKNKRAYMAVSPKIDQSDGSKPATFIAMVYGGGIVVPTGYGRLAVVDLETMTVGSDQMPCYRGHDDTRFVGFSSDIKLGPKKIDITGTINRKCQEGNDVLSHDEIGYEWYYSIAYDIDRRNIEPIREGETAFVNGRDQVGPFDILRGTILQETSFITEPVDKETVGKISQSRKKRKKMAKDKEKDLAAQSGADDEKKKELAARQEAADKEKEKELAAKQKAADEEKEKAAQGRQSSERTIKADRATRLIQAAGEHTDIATQAIENEWSIERTELECARRDIATLKQEASDIPRAKAQQSSGGGHQGTDNEAIQCGIIMRQYGEDYAKAIFRDNDRVLQSARDIAREGLTLGNTMDLLSRRHNVQVEQYRSNPMAQMRRMVQSGSLATIDLVTILGGTGERIAVEEFQTSPRISTVLCKVVPAKDFKAGDASQMIGPGRLKQVAADGTLEKGELVDQGWVIQTDTMGLSIPITRKMVINDDLGIFLDMFARMGRWSNESMELDFIELFVASSTYDGTNTFAGSYSLDSSAPEEFAAAQDVFARRTSTGKTSKSSLMLQGQIKHVVCDLVRNFQAQLLTGATGIVAGASGSAVLPMNPNIQLAIISHGTTRLPNSSTWYGVADPNLIPAFFLTTLGQSDPKPIVEQDQTAVGVLATTFSVYMDYNFTLGAKEGRGKFTAT